MFLAVASSCVNHGSPRGKLVFVVDDKSADLPVEESASSAITTAINVVGSFERTATSCSNLLGSQVEATVENDDATRTTETTICTATALSLNSELLADRVIGLRVFSLEVDVSTTAANKLVSALSSFFAVRLRISLNGRTPPIQIN